MVLHDYVMFFLSRGLALRARKILKPPHTRLKLYTRMLRSELAPSHTRLNTIQSNSGWGSTIIFATLALSLSLRVHIVMTMAPPRWKQFLCSLFNM